MNDSVTDRSQRVFVAGHAGMVGSAIVRRLTALGYTSIVTASREGLDLTDQRMVAAFFDKHAIEQVYVAAATVGGIHANNTYPAEFIYQNMMIEANLIHAAFNHGVKKLLFLGSSCIYPRNAPQPMKEEYLLTGTLEPTNERYGIAKIAGINLCESYRRQYGSDFRSVMPTNLYGPGDKFHPENSHVIPALMRRFHEAKIDGVKEVVVWGSGSPRREFLHVDDMASASVHVMELGSDTYWSSVDPMRSHIKVGTGTRCAISKIAELIQAEVEIEGNLVCDLSKPDRTSRKLLDLSKLNRLRWHASIPLDRGLLGTHRSYVAQKSFARAE